MNEYPVDRYEKVRLQWNKIFKDEGLNMPQQKKTENDGFDNSLSWLLEKASSVIDFGCANGNLLFHCCQYGTTKHIGIDLSSQGIANARENGKKISDREFLFICGGVDALASVEPSSTDAAILSNIIDNLYSEDAHCVLSEIKRILRPNGRLLVKLNPFLTSEQISEYGIQVIEGNLLDDGLILWNNSTEEWDRILNAYFYIDKFKNIYYEEYDQYNRLYQLING